MGDYGRAIGLLEEATAFPDAFDEKLKAVCAALQFDAFLHCHSEDAALKSKAPASRRKPALNPWAARKFHTGWMERGKAIPDGVQLAAADEAATDIWTPDFGPQTFTGYYAAWRFVHGGTDWSLALVRSIERGLVSPREMHDLEPIVPALNRALHLAHHIAETHATGLYEGLATSDAAAILLDRKGNARHVTPQAHALFGSDFGIRDGQIWSAHAETNRKLQEVATAAGQPEPSNLTGPFPVKRINEVRPLLARPLAFRGRGLHGSSGITVALFLSGPRSAAMVTAPDLQLLFGLSNAEAQIALLLGEGLDVKQVAERRNTSVGTVRIQMKQIFQKTRVRRQPELIRTLAALRLPSNFTHSEYT